MRTRLGPTTRFAVAASVASREIEGQVLLMTGDDDGLLTLNATAQFIWARIALRRDLQTIVRAFARHFRVSAAVATRDVTAFLALLERRRIITRA